MIFFCARSVEEKEDIWPLTGFSALYIPPLSIYLLIDYLSIYPPASPRRL